MYGFDIKSIHQNFILKNSQKKILKLISTKNKYVINEFVEQGSYAKQIYAGSTNTIRMTTMIDPLTGEVFIPITCHKFGTSLTGPTDNMSRGGINAYINTETGIIENATIYANKKIIYVKKHPDTGFELIGFKIPHWEKVKAEVVEVAKQVDFLKYVGWDVAVLDDGIRIIEGNSNPDLINQIYTPFFDDERITRFFKHHKIIK